MVKGRLGTLLYLGLGSAICTLMFANLMTGDEQSEQAKINRPIDLKPLHHSSGRQAAQR